MRTFTLALSTVILSLVPLSDAAAIPAYARRYNVNCSFCHSPAVPRLNATGVKFRWAGYRMPEDIGQQVNVDRVSNYIAMRGRFNYDYAKASGETAEKSGFEFTDATLFFSGAFGTNYGAFFELEREGEDEIGLNATFVGAWGNENSFGGFRVGQFHWLLRDGMAGFDRPTGLRTPLALGSPLTDGGVPFKYSKDQLGLEVFYVTGMNRVSAEVLNGISRTGGNPNGDADNQKDFALIDQFIFDDAGSGITAVAYFGTVAGAEPLEPTMNAKFTRYAVSANKFFGQFELMGGVVFGEDKELPVVTNGNFGSPNVKGSGYWGYAGYTLPQSEADGAGVPPTVYGRYEFVDPNTDVNDNGITRYVAGIVVPVGLPEYLRFALEYALDTPQDGGKKKTGVTAQMMLNF